MGFDELPIYWPPRKRIKQADSEKLKANAWKHWNEFYRQHKDNFFKDRHYLVREFPELLSGSKVVLEVGCGVGNTVFPLLRANPELFIHACDFAPEAISCLQKHAGYSSGKVNAFVCNVVKDDLPQKIEKASVDVCTVIFVLSAISPEDMLQAVRNVAHTLKPGGVVFLRDYAEGDLAEILLSSGQITKCMDKQSFVRGDGTFSYYFTQDILEQIFLSAGLKCISCHVHEKEVVNHATGAKMARKWIQAKFTLGPHTSIRKAMQTPSLDMSLDKTTIPCGEWEEIEDANNLEGCGSLFQEVFEPEEVKEEYELDGLGSVEVLSISRESRHTLTHTGLMLWDAAHIFASYLARSPNILEGKSVLELGSGINPLCSLACLRHASKLVATDGSFEVLLKLAQNLSLNSRKVVIERVRLRELTWGNQDHLDQLSQEFPTGFEVIIGADVVYEGGNVPLLFKAARFLFSKQKKAILLLCHLTRRVSEDKICSHANASGFALKEAQLNDFIFPPAIRLLSFELMEAKIGLKV